jgi:glycosyltransferase involved in cell wall biosynthesis
MIGLISVIVPTFNREDALDAVLRSLWRQSDRNFEVIVADDGSGVATAKVITEWVPRIGVPLKHVWHEKRGFRAAEIRNRAIRASAGAYCIFLDGDCIARRDFVAVHRRLAEPGWFVTGNRILLSRELTERILRGGLELEHWGLADWLTHRSRRNVNRFAPLIALRLGLFRKLKARRWQGARSCNVAMWRADLDKVDGFDATFGGWGREDSDIFVRLIRSGVRRKDGRFATGVLHLWHPEADRASLPDNDQLLKDVVSGDRIRARRGLSCLTETVNQARVSAS